jgi:hypothetical protein
VGGRERLGKNWDEGLHNGLASFEMRPQFKPGAGSLGAPQDEDKALMALRKFLILRRPRSGCLEGRMAPIQPTMDFLPSLESSSRIFPGSAHLIPGSASEFPGSVGYGKSFASG